MKYLLLVFFLVFLTACTSLKPINMTASELREEIYVKKLVKPGDEIKLHTSSGKTHQFKVTALTPVRIKGENFKKGKRSDIAVPINEISAVNTKKIDTVKTIALVAGIAAIAVITYGAVDISKNITEDVLDIILPEP